MTDMFVVSGDNHGRPELIYGVAQYYEGQAIQQIVVGDVIDGPDTKAALQAMCDVGAVSIMGNREWYLLASALELDEERRYEYATSAWHRTHDKVLDSYSVYPSIPSPRNAQRLLEKMPECHSQKLITAPLYIETDTEVIIHAGLTTDSWWQQKRCLDERQKLCQENRRFAIGDDYIPDQIGSGEPLYDENIALSGVGKLVINGHTHRPFTGYDNRLTADGQRLYLATTKTDEFVLVWESWTGRLVRISQDGQEMDSNDQAAILSAT